MPVTDEFSNAFISHLGGGGRVSIFVSPMGAVGRRNFAPHYEGNLIVLH